jgi:hypothetical protein
MQDFVGGRLRRVAMHLAAADAANGGADAGVEQAQVIVNLRLRRNCRAWVTGGILLANRDRGRNSAHFIDVRLVHALEELARISRQRFDVSPLPFGINRVECQ